MGQLMLCELRNSLTLNGHCRPILQPNSPQAPTPQKPFGFLGIFDLKPRWTYSGVDPIKNFPSQLTLRWNLDNLIG